MTDFIIVGRGLAATVLMHRFYKSGISFKTIGIESLSSSSRIAAGIWNPIVFKRFTKSWLANELISELNLFYTDCETRLGKKLLTQRPIIKPFTEEQERILWSKKAKNELSDFLTEKLNVDYEEELIHCNVPNGYGVVKQSGSLDVEKFLDASSDFFKEYIVHEIFNHDNLTILRDGVVYNTIKASNIVFCEGHLVSQNPFFRWIPLKLVKGEILEVECTELNLNDSILNKGAFLMKLAPGRYKLGATYDWSDLGEQPTDGAREQLEQKLHQMTSCNYKVINHKAGVRPASIDRRPVIGVHPKHNRLFVFNGLGTKGVMLAPFFSKNFVNFYLKKEEIYPDVDLKRFYKIYEGL